MSTLRQQIIDLLLNGESSAKDISQELSIREKEVYDHLSHIARSVASQKQKLIIIPSECLSCGYVFKSRERFTRPGRCPKCRGERILEPRYCIGDG